MSPGQRTVLRRPLALPLLPLLLLLLLPWRAPAVRLRAATAAGAGVGDCDKYSLCQEYHRTNALASSLCDPAAGCFDDSASAINCVLDGEFYIKHRCQATDCLEVEAQTDSSSDCAWWFPHIAGTSMEREPAPETTYDRLMRDRRQDIELGALQPA